MSLSVIDAAVRSIVDSGLVGPALSVIWHAGEPLVLPPDYYAAAFDAVRAAAPSACVITHSIQTNGTLIDEKWCALLGRPDVRVGISLDGPQALHDRHRKTRSGTGTHALVMRGIEHLRRHQISFHVIAVVTEEALECADELCDFFIGEGIRDVGFNFDEIEGINSRSTLAGKEHLHRRFVGQLLERMMQPGDRLRVRELTNAYRVIADGVPTQQWRKSNRPYNSQTLPFAIVTVAWNGDFSTFSPELLGQSAARFQNFVLGNVLRDTLNECVHRQPFETLWREILRGEDACRRSCRYYYQCGGGAPANKFYENGGLDSTETLYCRTMIQRPLDAVLTHLERARDASRSSAATDAETDSA